LMLAGCRASPNKMTTSKSSIKTALIVFEADSLIVPFAQMEKEFEASNPDIDVQLEAHGSIQVIRQVTELGKSGDIVAVADSSLIPMLMYKTMMPDGKPFGNWYIAPATNDLVIAFSPKSAYADQINAENWYKILSQPDVKVGFSDPRMDAVGYRTLMLTKLAEAYYGQQDIMSNTVGKYFSTPITSQESNGIVTITVPELLDPVGNHMYFRGANTQLMALLETGDIDYTFEYKSVVQQHNLKYVELPDQINLSSYQFAANYGTVTVAEDFRRFGSVAPVFNGIPIEYGISIPANAEHYDAAVRFIQFLLGPDGQRIFQGDYQPLLTPPKCDNIDALPESLKSYFQ